ncbi:Wall-associated receptor kinase galacturonan-binding domain-containing protein [Cynara cardunculus var. scolymus]|uniref:Wall-associated receptor kinase galacturonan-binding domain-containing protein n=1 Tax=Cynara cardunculus var. scolymus TaxID=59895 RepID=A0A103X6A7_CYNCS|nr:Wall-associated receptor kinase galacturonan-binding domain-containing protein [Cynara cardunculus var. scolymus]
MFSFATAGKYPTSKTYSLVNATNLAKPGCDSRWGDLIVPYPFGIGTNSNCSIGDGFDIHYNTSSDPPKASIRKTDYNSIKQISDSTLHISNMVATSLFDDSDIANSTRYVDPWTYAFFGDEDVFKFKPNQWAVLLAIQIVRVLTLQGRAVGIAASAKKAIREIPIYLRVAKVQFK